MFKAMMRYTLVGFGLLASAAYSEEQKNQWLTVQSVSTPVYLELPALVEAVAQATVSAQTSGRIIELPFDVNDFVKQGDVVVRFTDAEQKARLQQAQASLNEADVRLHEMATELSRVQDIYSKRLVAKAALDMAQANFNAAKARQAQASAQVKAAAEQLEQTVVRAPYSGILQQRLVEVGELAIPGKPLLVGLSLQHLRLVSQLPQQQLPAVQQSPTAVVQTPDGQSLTLDKPTLTIAPQANQQSHSFLLRVKLPELSNQTQLYPGSWVRLKLQTTERPQIHLPKDALLWRGEVAMVWLKTASGSILQPVRVRQAGDGYQLISGLVAGDVIAANALALLAQQSQPAAAAATEH